VRVLWTIVLLVASNVFMNLAWYGHLKFKDAPLVAVVFIAWGIALFEYALQVPANRIGHDAGLSASKLKTLQEVISLATFVVFAWAWLGEVPRWNTIVGFSMIGGGALLLFAPWQR
jgi:uncharacterized protein (DUF486 family)